MLASQILFVINLFSGKEKKREHLLKKIQENFPEANIFIINHKEDFLECSKIASEENYKYIIINGGDGTISGFLPIIIKQKKVLGILPSGSGNGLARSLNIPSNPVDALQRINEKNVKQIDIGKIIVNKEEYYFSCAVGFGIDANIAERFERQKTRGLSGYLIAGIKEFFNYKKIKSVIDIDKKIKLEGEFLILSVMNIPQYGNDFYLSPSARVDDHLLNVVLLRKINMFLYPYVLYNFITRKEKFPVEYYTARTVSIEIIGKGKLNYHIDGEPKKSDRAASFYIEILPSALQVMY